MKFGILNKIPVLIQNSEPMYQSLSNKCSIHSREHHWNIQKDPKVQVLIGSLLFTRQVTSGQGGFQGP